MMRVGMREGVSKGSIEGKYDTQGKETHEKLSFQDQEGGWRRGGAMERDKKGRWREGKNTNNSFSCICIKHYCSVECYDVT